MTNDEDVKSLEYSFRENAGSIAVINQDQSKIAALIISHDRDTEGFRLIIYPGDDVGNTYMLEMNDPSGLVAALNKGSLKLEQNGRHSMTDIPSREGHNVAEFIAENISGKHEHSMGMQNPFPGGVHKPFAGEQILTVVARLQEQELISEPVANTLRDFVSRQHPGEDVSLTNGEVKGQPKKGTEKE